MTESHELKVSVSGKDVYKAVANYIKNSPELQQSIKDKVESFLTSEMLEQALRKRLENEVFNNWRIKEETLAIIQDAAKKQVKKSVTEEVLAGIIKKTFSKIIVGG